MVRTPPQHGRRRRHRRRARRRCSTPCRRRSPTTSGSSSSRTSSELQLQQPHTVYLEAQPAGPDGKGAVTIRDLFVDSLRMRPDRIVVGEVRRGEALDLIQSMLSGHDGSLSTVHASTPRLALVRLETLCLMSDVDLPVYVARTQVASAIHVVVAGGPAGRRQSPASSAIAEVGGLGQKRAATGCGRCSRFRHDRPRRSRPHRRRSGADGASRGSRVRSLRRPMLATWNRRAACGSRRSGRVEVGLVLSHPQFRQ